MPDRSVPVLALLSAMRRRFRAHLTRLLAAGVVADDAKDDAPPPLPDDYPYEGILPWG
jgi:hypothetical protein